MRLILAAFVVALAAPSVAAGQGAVFPLGVAAGEVRADSAILWAAVSRPGPVRIEVSLDRRFRGMPIARVQARPTALRDLVVQRRVAGLAPDRRYFYRFCSRAATSPVGAFRTAPRPGQERTIRFAITGDADGARRPGTTRPAYNGFQVYGRMAAAGNHFNINLGDTIYSDSEVAGLPPALTARAKAGKYHENLGYAALRRLRATAGLYSHWDDHEFVNDFSIPEHGRPLYAAGVRAFRHYAPVTWSPAEGLYRTFRWGRHLELFFLDQRSFRSAKATRPCGADLAPTAPQPVRDAFATLAPSLARPVPQACLDAIADPSRTMLGARQLAAFARAIRSSTATWKVVVNEVPVQQFYANPYDRWEGYAAERARLLDAVAQAAPNVVFLTTDAHGNFVNEVRRQTLEEGGPVETGIWEIVTGPVATNTYAREVDELLGSSGAGQAVSALFFKPAPPRGVGMACSAPDVYSYAQVVVAGGTLTVTPRDASGRIVREVGGAPCGPFVLGRPP